MYALVSVKKGKMQIVCALRLEPDVVHKRSLSILTMGDPNPGRKIYREVRTWNMKPN